MMQPTRQAAALLFILLLIVTLSSTTTLALQQWRSAHISSTQFSDEQQVLRLVHDGIGYAQKYLREHHTDIVTIADEQIHGIPIRHDAINNGDTQIQFSMIAYDLHAAIPAELLNKKSHTAHALRQVLPKTLQNTSLQNLQLNSAQQDASLIWTASTLSDEKLRYPSDAIDSPLMQWTNNLNRLNEQSDPSEFVLPDEHSAWTTWVNPFTKKEININTCSQALLEWALRTAEQEQQFDGIVNARANGERVAVPQVPNNKRLPFTFIDASTHWTVDLHIQINEQHYRYLAVITCAESAEIIQILAVPEQETSTL